ncbi:hypothetical protein DV096_04240 [Bradymonadaceae bacterium TMQ3]|nr:hypothetical protein DV096_04240 [Bradymonadaceae bacterium TMQ3]TXC77474.1 redoxin domain-containing protein [Bradymonadales bacterium TMQ1]
MRLTPCTHGVRPPEFPELPWINVEQPLCLSDLLGQVVVLGFWSSSCIRCQEGLPAMRRAMQRFEGQALKIITVHSPRFPGEHDLDYLHNAVERVGVPFAVAIDNDHRLARTFNVRELPTLALIDPHGYVCRVLRGVPEPLQLIETLEDLLGLTDAPRSTPPAPMPAQPSPASLSFPAGISARDDRVAIADTGHHRIILTAPDGEVIDCFGGPEPGFEDGPADRARFFSPRGLVFVENQLLVADTANHAIRSIDLSSSEVNTLARLADDASGEHHAPWSLTRQCSWLFVACASTHTILRLHTDGSDVGRFAGTGDEDRIDGHRRSAAFAQPTGLQVDGEELIIIDSTTSALRSLNMHSNRVQTLIGKSLFEHGLVDGTSRDALMQHPRGIAVHGGRVYIADALNRTLRCFDPKRQELHTLDTPAFEFPTAIASTEGSLWVCDTHAHTFWHHDIDTGTWTRLELTWPDQAAMAR